MPRRFPVLLLMIPALLLCNCGGYERAVYLGVLGPETGSYEAFGVEGYRGADLAVRAVAKRGLTDEELKYQTLHYDGGEDLEVLERLFRRLVEVDGVSAIVFTDPRPAAVRLAGRLSTELETATLLVADTLNTSAELEAPHLYNLTVPFTELIPRIVEVADEWAMMDKVALINDSPPLYELYRPLYLAELERREELTFTELTISFTEQDYQTAAFQLLAEDYDGVIVNGGADCLVELLQACAELTYHPAFVAPVHAKPARLELPELYILDEGYFVGGFAVSDERALAVSFAERYRANVGYRPGPVGAAAYDAARLARRAVARADSAEAPRVAGALAALDSFEGLMGEYDLENPPHRSFVEATVPAATGVRTELVEEAPLLSLEFLDDEAVVDRPSALSVPNADELALTPAEEDADGETGE